MTFAGVRGGGKGKCTLAGDLYAVADADGLAVLELGAEDFALSGVGEELGAGHCGYQG